MKSMMDVNVIAEAQQRFAACEILWAIVCGSRDGWDFVKTGHALKAAFAEGCAGTMPCFDGIAVGSAQGVDWEAWQWAMRNEMPALTIPATWKNGHTTNQLKAQGPRRNRRMHTYAKPVVVLGLPGGHGTKDMLRVGVARGTPTYVWSEYDQLWLQDD